MKIKVSTDSTADIPSRFQQDYGITVLPLTILTEDEREYRDGVDIIPKDFYPILENCIKAPVSAAIPPLTYLEYYESVFAEGYTDIIMSR